MSAATERLATAYEQARAELLAMRQDDAHEVGALADMIDALHEELEQERSIVRSQGEVIGRLQAGTARLYEAIRTQEHVTGELRLLVRSGEAVLQEPAESTPAVTERFLFKTTREGVRLDEVSVAIAWPELPDHVQRAALLADAHHAGEAEAARRNAAGSDGGA